ncbi:universal stress protein [Umezawaea endophytica]|uniref:Universal stress protein n=1 Tax=Umezawaea endophytica TaxID=1654476 RepID=A0A9X2VHS7_9PSEU|nr:universal stress protein [Umezawaea endophytica]MCS7476886.1 universal stress protein [Umezawaea endophytica]
MEDRAEPVVVMATPHPDAIRWAAAYADRRGSSLRVLHVAPRVPAVVDELRAAFPGLLVEHRLMAEAIGDALLTESEHAHSIVVADAGDGDSVVTALSALARCPVISVPPNAVWHDSAAPVVVGVHHPERTARKLEFAFTEAEKLGTGVRLVRCEPSRRPADDLDEVLTAFTALHPDVPVHTEVLGTSAWSALAWHAHFGSMVVLGSRRGGAVRGALVRSITRAVLRQRSSPVVVIGRRARRTSPVSPELGSAKS